MELGTDDVHMNLHLCNDIVIALEHARVAELIELIVTDGLDLQRVKYTLDVAGACGDAGDTRAGEGYLRGGCEFEEHILVAVFFGLRENFDKLIGKIGKIVKHVCIIPEHAEVLCRRLHRSDTLNRFGGIGKARGVGILGNAPHTLYGFIGRNELFYHIHIGAVLVKRYIDHFDAEEFADSKMSVISGNGTKEGDLIVLRPGLAAVLDGVKHTACNRIVHKVQARVAADDDMIGGNSKHFAKQTLHFVNAVKSAIVTAVAAGFGKAFFIGLYRSKKAFHCGNLLCRGLAARHIELKSHCFIFFELFNQLLFLVHFKDTSL